jgi:hypothetical protein
VKQAYALPVLFTLAIGGTACPDHDERLEAAIRQYVDQREAEVQAVCACYQLFVNLDDIVDHGMFTSEEECLAVLGLPPEESVVDCMNSVLDSSDLSTKDSVYAVKCDTEMIAELAHCHAQNVGGCASSCSTDYITPLEECRGQLTEAQRDSLYDCTVKI